MLKRKSIKEVVVEGVGAIWFFLALVSTVVLIVLNCTPIYRYVINRYQLTTITGLPDFSMSEAGMIHFAEVKHIFLVLYVIVLLFILAFGVFLVTRHHHKDKCILSTFNRGANLTFLTFGILIFFITINFSGTFTVFHKLFFNNNYWMFDYRTDPVILALPEQLFMIISIIIIMSLFAICGYIKYVYYKGKKSLAAR